MRNIESFCEIEPLAKHVERFAQEVILRMRRLPQLSPDLKYHLMEIKDIRAPIRIIYLEELSIRLEQSKPPLEKLEKTASEILSEISLPKADV
jgi:hypothetical protein